MDTFFVLKGCTIDNFADYIGEHLSANLDDYPGGIVLPVDKPYRWTSADVVRKFKFQLQRHFHQKNIKVGHAGTLDPLATGLLLVCIGKATKISEELQSHDKEYLATIEFGATTPSYDLEQPIDSYYPYTHITPELIKKVMKDFIGTQEQVPPVFSAKYINGLRAYEYARNGEPVEMKKSVITIHDIELVEFKEGLKEGLEIKQSDIIENPEVQTRPRYNDSASHSDGTRPSAMLRIKCSKGTYIRSLARDLGLSLGSGAYLTSLRRTSSGSFSL